MKLTPSRERQAFLEMLCFWQGYVRNKDLQLQFGVSRQQAYQDIRNYIQQHPHRLQKTSVGYRLVDASLLSQYQLPLDTFLNWLLTGQFMSQQQRTASDMVACLQLPSRCVSREVIVVLNQAIRQQKRVEIGYVSLSNPDWEGRIFHPHSFVKTGIRWHVRGYCEKSRDYRDLVLSRCQGSAELLDSSFHRAENDLAWQTNVSVILAPDPRLSASQQAVLAHDYGMEAGRLCLQVRAALVDYLLKDMQVNTKYLDGTPEAQQLVLVNRDDIKPWLFNP